MKLHQKITLIPRNNWDYGFRALFCSLAGSRNNSANSQNIEEIYQTHPIWTNSGRTSLYAILKALELPSGAKVGVPLYCCSVVFNSICQAGLSPCFLDSNINDCNISVEDLCKKHADLAAVVATHMFGNPCDIDAINTISDGVPVIEDCAHSIFSTYKGKLTGLLSTASFFSFRCGKYISAGEGSTIFCKDLELQEKIEQIINSFESSSNLKMLFHSCLTFGKAIMYNRPWYGLIGYPIGMRLDKKLNLTAKDGFEPGKIATTCHAIIEARVASYQEKINTQREHAHILLNTLKPHNFSIPSISNGCTSNWYQFALRFQSTDQRDTMADYLLCHGIDTSKYLDDISNEAHVNYGYQYGDCPNAELLSKTVLLVPIHYTLQMRDIENIARSINEGSMII